MDPSGIPIPSEHCFPPKSDGNGTEEERELYQRIANVVDALQVPNDLPNILSMVQYQGLWYTKPILTALMTCQHHFQALPTDVLLTTVPRSGTTWFKALIFSTVHRRTYHPSSSTHPLLSRNPHELVPFLDYVYATGCFPDLARLGSPRLLSTHVSCSALPESVEQSQCKIVHVFRNNRRANAVSQLRFGLDWLHLDEKQLPLEDFVEGYAAGTILFGPAWDVIGGYSEESQKDPERVLLLRYEEAEAETLGTLRKLARFLRCPFSPEEEASGVPSAIVELCNFGRLSRLEVNRGGSADLVALELDKKIFFTKEENSKWVGRLTPEMGDRLERLLKEKLGARDLEI